MLKNKKIRVFSRLLIMFIFLFSPFDFEKTFASGNTGISSAIDTIAGYAGLIKAKTDPDTEVEFMIEKPDNTKLIIPDQSDNQGNIEFDLNGYHTRKAGIYKVAIKNLEDNNYSPFTSFKVHPDELSSEKSQININKQSINADNYDNGIITVKLFDKYLNPIPNHNVNIISSREQDQIIPVKRKFSDENGEIRFSVSSREEGISIYSVFDSSIGKTLTNRIKVIYHQTSESKNFMGGETNVMMIAANDNENTNDDNSNDYSAPNPEEDNALNLKIDNIPEAIEINKSINFKVSAIDDIDNINPNYLGTIHFSVESDPNAHLPTDYTFTPEDLGEHTFSLSLSFSIPGTHTLKVQDADNEKIKGETTITIEEKETTSPTETEFVIQITAPQAGTYNYRNLTIEGSAPNLAPVVIYDNDQEIGKSTADNQGKFSFTTEALDDGVHTLHVTGNDEKGNISGTSSELKISIDTAAPTIETVEISPPGPFKTGDEFTVKLFSEKGLSEISVIFNDNLYPMTPDLDSTGLYTASLTAPEKDGEYSLDFVLVDELGNEDTVREKSTVVVSGKDSPAPPESLSVPPKVTGIESTPGENKITLNWQAVEAPKQIKNYKIYYGASEENLDNNVNTFTNDTTWYIPDLTPGTEYYFSITAIDEEGNESKEKSDIVSNSPLINESIKPASPVESDPEIGGGENYLSEAEPIEKNTDSGPETIWIIACSIMFVELVFLGKKLLQKKSGTTIF